MPPAPPPHPAISLSDIFRPGINREARSLLDRTDLELTYNARGALFKACVEIATHGRREILIPAFHCPSGVTPAIEAGMTPVFYRIRRDLSVDYQDLLSKVTPNTGAVIVIHFFGLATDLAPLAGLKAKQIPIIEDWSHSFLQGSPPRLAGGGGDYQIFSFWKLVPSIVGGGLLRRHAAPSLAPLSTPLSERAARFKLMIEEALEHSDHRRTRAAFMQLENLRLSLRGKRGPEAAPASAPVPVSLLAGEAYYPFDRRLALAAMPGTARRVIESSDLAEVARRRRTNFQAYAGLLQGKGPLQLPCPTLPDEACPWVFPALLENRDVIDRQWRGAGVALHTFGIYLHSALDAAEDRGMVDDALYLARHLLCLSIHQQVSPQDIERSAATILRQPA